MLRLTASVTGPQTAAVVHWKRKTLVDRICSVSSPHQRKVFDVVKKKKPVSVFSGLSKINLSESQGRLSHFSRPIPPFNQNSLNARTEQSNEF